MAENFIYRDGVLAIQDDKVLKPIFNELSTQTYSLPLMRQVGNLPLNKNRIAVQDALAFAYWVNPSEAADADTAPGHKSLTNAKWANKYLTAGEIACIIPVPDSISYDNPNIWELVKDAAMNAIRAKIDEAVLVGTKPETDWPDPIIEDAAAKAALGYGYKVVRGTNLDLAADFSEAMSCIERVGYNPSNILALPDMRRYLRDARDASGAPLINPITNSNGGNSVYQVPLTFVNNGSFDSGDALAIVGDFKQCVYAFRNSIEIKIASEAVLQDPDTKEIIMNTFQQDSKAMRITMWLAWQYPNPISRIESVAAKRYPFSIITAP
jgi:hypothetical protein